MTGCARCARLRAALDQGDDERILELLEDLYQETGAEPELMPRGGAGPNTLGEVEGRPSRIPGRAA